MPIGASPTATSEDIARVEARIEQLTASIERCRKISLAAKIAVAAGLGWTAFTLFGIVAFEPATFIAALALAIGGAVLLGSNKTTWEQTEAARRASETLRAEMIGRLELHMIGDADTPRLH